MEGFFGQPQTTRTPAALAEKVVTDAKRSFAQQADDAILNRIVLQAVDELVNQPPRVTTFLPVLALRRVRELLETGRPAPEDGPAGA